MRLQDYLQRIGSMNCKATVGMICEYLEGRLSPVVALAMRRHIAECSNCRLVLDAAQHTLVTYSDSEQYASDKVQAA